MKSPFLLFITPWMILVLSQGSDGNVQNLNSDEFRILSDKIESLLSTVQNKDEQITKLQDQVKDISIRLQDSEVKIGKCLQKEESEFKILSDKIETQNEEITKLQGQVGNCLQKQQSELLEMSKKITDPEIQRHIGKLGYSGIEFVAVSESYIGHLPTGKIKFEAEEIDVNDSFNKDTGIFQPSEDGLYAFHFNAFVYHSRSAIVNVNLNGDHVEEIWHNDDASHYRQLIGFWTMDLKAYDQLYLYNYYSSSIFIDDSHGMYWMGLKLK